MNAVLLTLFCLNLHAQWPVTRLEAGDTPPSTGTPLSDGPPGHVSTLKGLGGVSQFIAFLPDGKHVASSARGGTRVWELASGKQISIGIPSGISAVSPDGKLIAVAWKSKLHLIETESGNELGELSPAPAGTPRTVAWSPDGKWIATGGDGSTVQLWNVKDRLLSKDLKGHSRRVQSLAFSRDSTSLLSGGQDRTLRSWDVDSGQESRAPIKTGFDLWSLQYSHDSRFILGAGRHEDIFLWDAETGTEIRRLSGHIAFVHRAVFLPDGRRVVSGSDDRTVRCWDAQTGRELARFEGHRCNILDVAVSPDGRFAASAGGGITVNGRWNPGEDFDIRVWRLPKLNSVSSGHVLTLTALDGGPSGVYSSLSHPKYHLTALDMTPDGRLLASGDKAGVVRVSEAASNRTLGRFQLEGDQIRTLTFSPDGSHLVAGTRSRKLRLWNVKGRQLQLQHDDAPFLIVQSQFFPDGRRVLISTTRDVQVWDTETDEFVALKGSGFRAHALAVSPDGGTVAAACHDALVRVWDAESLELLYELKGHTDQVMAVDFDPASQRLVTGARDHAVKIWNVTTGELIRTLNGHADIVLSTRFLSDGLRLLTGANWRDGLIRLWNSETGEQLWTHPADSTPVLTLETTADARFAVARTAESVELLRLPPIQNTSVLDAYKLAQKNKGPSVTLAVLGFADVGPSAELAPLRHALAELLTARLGQFDRIDTVERRIVDQFLRETALANTGVIDPETAQQAAKALTADYLLSGTFSGEAGRVTINASLSKMGNSDPPMSFKVSTAATDLFAAEKELTRRVLESFDITRPELDGFPPREPESHPTVAVTPFQNLGDISLSERESDDAQSVEDSNALRESIAEFLQATLSVLPDMTLVERDRLNGVLAEQNLTMAGLVDPTTASRVGKLVGADRFIYGSYLRSGDQLTVIARLADTESAQILGTEIADGTSDDLVSLFEQLAQRLARHMNVRQPENAANLLRQAVPVRKLEAATYASRANSFLKKGDYEAAFRNFDRVLLVEPDNASILGLYIRQLYRHDRHERVIDMAEAALARPKVAKNHSLKATIYTYYLNSLRRKGQNDKRIEVARQWARESPPNTYAQKKARLEEAKALRRADRRAEAIAMLEADVMKVEAADNPIAYGNELAWLYSFYTGERYSYGSSDPLASEDSAKRVVEIAETLLQLAEGRQGRSVGIWGQYLVPHAVNMTYRKPGSYTSHYIMSTEERIDFLNRVRAVFAWDREILSRASFLLARCYSIDERWPEVMTAFQDFRANPHFVADKVISRYDREFVEPTDWIDRHIEAQYRIGQILHQILERPQDAVVEFQKYVRNFGLVNAHGPHVLKRLVELGAEPEFPGRSVLLWGGATESLKSWQKVLRPLGFRTHLARKDHLTAADLAPYDLVILARSGDIPFEPVDILGLRSYVATGGSLMVAVSPAWEAAAPMIHSGLLSLFDMRVGSQSIDPAPATKIDANHPITRKLPALTARHAVDLESPYGTSLVESNGSTILAALPYRHGRVVVSSFGQWFMPDPSIFGSTWQRDIASRSGLSQPVQSMPLQSFSGTHATLIHQTVEWLTESRSPEESVDAERAVIAAAWRSARQYEAQAITREQMTESLNRVIDRVDGEWKEEALWLAGEAHFRMQYFDQRSFLRWAPYGYPSDGKMPPPMPQYFERLVSEFPDSPLLGFAQWRHAECQYRPVTYHGTRNLATIDDEVRRSLMAQYGKVTALEGSLPWTLTQSRLGRIQYWNGDFGAAARHFHSISEKAPPSVARISALLDLSLTYSRNNQSQKALTAAKAAMTMPNVELVSSSHGHYGTLIDDHTESQEVAEDFAKRLGDRN